MPARRSPRSIRRLDGVKFAVLLILSVLAIVLFVAISWQQKQQILPPVVVVTPVPTFTAEAVVAAPVMVSPLTGETVTSGAVQVSGTAAPGATVQVTLDGQPMGTAIAGENGAWSLLAQVPSPGEHALGASIVNGLGQVVSAGEPISVTVASLAVRSPSLDGDLLTANLAAGVVTLTGSGEPGSTVEVLVDGKPVGQAVVDEQGRWTLPADIRAPGVYSFALNAVDAGGKVVATATPVRLIIDPPVQAVAAVPPTDTATPVPTPPTRLPPPRHLHRSRRQRRPLRTHPQTRPRLPQLTLQPPLPSRRPQPACRWRWNRWWSRGPGRIGVSLSPAQASRARRSRSWSTTRPSPVRPLMQPAHGQSTPRCP